MKLVNIWISSSRQGPQCYIKYHHHGGPVGQGEGIQAGPQSSWGSLWNLSTFLFEHQYFGICFNRVSPKVVHHNFPSWQPMWLGRSVTSRPFHVSSGPYLPSSDQWPLCSTKDHHHKDPGGQGEGGSRLTSTKRWWTFWNWWTFEFERRKKLQEGIH